MHASRPQYPRRLPHGQSGVSLLEVLIAVLILAIGMLGIAALQSVSLRNTQGSSERTNAIIQSYAMLDMMRANRDAASSGSYDQGLLCDAPTGASTRIQRDIARWINQLETTVGPTACGTITCDAETCEVTVSWDDSRETGGAEEGDTQVPQSITTESRI